MQASAGKMQMLIDDLLAYTKVMNDENRLEKVDLNAILEEVRNELKETLEEKGALLKVTALPFVKGIGFQLRQLFINLISNSIKFAKAEEQAVVVIDHKEVFRQNVGDTATETPKLYHCITVSDNGIGFDSAYRHDIFKVFYRLQTGKYKGTGIGLAICRKIAEANGGFIEADGEEGKGASFSIYLPVA
jgi:two-component system, chemotaxis family, sensor kinase Cph1